MRCSSSLLTAVIALSACVAAQAQGRTYQLGSTPSEEEIKAYCRQSLAEYKVPHLVEFRGELPKTDVGKVSRRELRDEHAA